MELHCQFRTALQRELVPYGAKGRLRAGHSGAPTPLTEHLCDRGKKQDIERVLVARAEGFELSNHPALGESRINCA